MCILLLFSDIFILQVGILSLQRVRYNFSVVHVDFVVLNFCSQTSINLFNKPTLFYAFFFTKYYKVAEL